MIRSILFASAALMAASLAVSVTPASELLSIGAEAEAADFTGKIKRIKIKKRRTGSGFKVVARTGGDDAGSVASAEVTLSTTDGEVLEQLTLDDPGRARVKASAQLDGFTPGSSITVMATAMLEAGCGGDPFGCQQEFEVSVDGLEARTAGEGSSEDGWKVRATVSETGAVQLTILSEDKDWEGGIRDIFIFPAADAEAAPATVDEVRQKWTQNLEADLTDIGAVQVATVLYDADGQILDSQTEQVNLDATVAPTGLDSVAVRETKKGDTKLVTWTTSDGNAAALEVELTDAETGEVALMTVDDTPIRTQRSFVFENLEFDPGESPADYIYLALIDLISEAGDPVGEQYEVELTVPGYEEGAGNATNYAPFADGAGAVSVIANENGFHVHVVYEGEDVSEVQGVNVIFEEPYEGPAPLETEANAGLWFQFDKWIQKGVTAVPESYQLTATLTSPEGEVLESVSASGGGTGKAYVGDSGGVRKYGDILIDGVPLEFD